jgi:hypothetical protein
MRAGDSSEGVPLMGNWSEKLPTSREHDVLPVMVLTGVLSPPHLKPWPSHCQSWPSHCQWCQRLHHKRDYLAVKGGPNLGPRHPRCFWPLHYGRGHNCSLKLRNQSMAKVLQSKDARNRRYSRAKMKNRETPSPCQSCRPWALLHHLAR